jgi:hypothetical protein
MVGFCKLRNDDGVKLDDDESEAFSPFITSINHEIPQRVAIHQ